MELSQTTAKIELFRCKGPEHPLATPAIQSSYMGEYTVIMGFLLGIVLERVYVEAKMSHCQNS